jgi:hypothetical protein
MWSSVPSAVRSLVAQSCPTTKICPVVIQVPAWSLCLGSSLLGAHLPHPNFHAAPLHHPNPNHRRIYLIATPTRLVPGSPPQSPLSRGHLPPLLTCHSRGGPGWRRPHRCVPTLRWCLGWGPPQVALYAQPTIFSVYAMWRRGRRRPSNRWMTGCGRPVDQIFTCPNCKPSSSSKGFSSILICISSRACTFHPLQQ